MLVLGPYFELAIMTDVFLYTKCLTGVMQLTILLDNAISCLHLLCEISTCNKSAISAHVVAAVDATISYVYCLIWDLIQAGRIYVYIHPMNWY